jgi:hypothetical protein
MSHDIREESHHSADISYYSTMNEPVVQADTLVLSEYLHNEETRVFSYTTYLNGAEEDKSWVKV